MPSYNEQKIIGRKSIDVDERETDTEAASPTSGGRDGDTQNDLTDMQRLGKTQEFQVGADYEKSFSV